MKFNLEEGFSCILSSCIEIFNFLKKIFKILVKVSHVIIRKRGLQMLRFYLSRTTVLKNTELVFTSDTRHLLIKEQAETAGGRAPCLVGFSKQQATNDKQQTTSNKRKAKSDKQQATSDKQQATSAL